MTQRLGELRALALADLLMLAGRFVSRPTHDAWSGPVDAQLARLAHHARVPAPDALRRTLHAALLELRDADRLAWQRERTRLFEGPVACPANETAYVRRDKGALIGDLCGFYHAFGFEPVEQSGEKPDHLLCELEFASLLLVMLAQAMRRQDAEATEVTEEALVAFLESHLGEWLGLFCLRLQAATDLPVLRAATEVLGAAWDAMALPLDLPGIEQLCRQGEPTLSNEDDGTPYECDMTPADPPAPITLTGPAGSGLPSAR
jgi:TorA maturation chaperone TorD